MNALLMRAAPYVGLVLMAVGWRACDVRRQQEIGAANERARVATLGRDSLMSVKDSLAKAFRVDTIRLTKAIIQRVPVRVEVDRWLHDTIPVPVEVVREIVRVDSIVIEACQIALGTCEAEKAALRLDLSFSEKQTAAFKAAMPSGFDKLRDRLLYGALGAGACWLWCPRR